MQKGMLPHPVSSGDENPSGHKILIVDGEPDNLEILHTLMVHNGFTVHSVENGLKALPEARSFMPDLVLLDIDIPEVNGFEVCGEFKNDDQVQDIPIIFLSSKEDVTDKIKGFSVGGVDYITKPYQFEEVVARVKTHLTLRDLHKKLEHENAQLSYEISERRQAEEALQASLNRTESLYNTSPSLIALKDLPELLQIIVDEISATLPADRVSLITFDTDQKQVDHFIFGGPGADDVAIVDVQELQEGLTGWVLTEQEPALSSKAAPDPRESSRVQKRRVETNCGSIVVVPLRYRNSTRGVITAINQPHQRDFAQADVDLMLLLANLAAAAIENTLLYAQLQNELDERKQIEEALRESEEKYRTILETMQESYYETDLAGNQTFFNDAHANAIGYSRDELMGMNYQQFIDEENARHVYTLFNETYRTGESRQLYDWEIIRKDGTKRAYESSIYLRYDKSGKPIGFRGFARDVTDRKQAEEALRAEKNRVQNYFEVASVIFVVLDAHGIITQINKAGCDVLGYEEDELLGENWFNTCLPVSARQSAIDGHMVGDLRNAEYYENSVLTKARQERVVVWNNIWLRDAAGNITHSLSSGMDITERKLAEESLRLSEERHRKISELISDFAFSWVLREDGRSEREWVTEDAYERITGYKPGELSGAASLFHPDDLELALHDIEQAWAGNQKSGEYRIITRAGEVRWINLHRYPEWDDDQQRVIRFYGAAKDITERKLTEDNLRESEERHRIISEMISDDVFEFSLDANGVWQHKWSNKNAYTQLTGYTEQETRYSLDHYHPDDVKTVERDLQKIKEGKFNRCEYRIITKTNDVRWILIHRQPIWDEKHTRVVGLYGSVKDITEQKQAEALLKENEEKYRNILETMQESYYETDLNGKHTFVNRAGSELLGYSEEELLSMNFRDYTDEATAERVYRETNKVYRTGKPQKSIEWEIIRKDGEKRLIEMSIALRHDASGKSIGFRGVSQDITERRQAEEERLKLKLEKERVRILASFIEDSSHEFRTPLAIINTSLYLLSKTNSQEKRLERFSRIQNEVENITSLVDDLVTMSRLDSGIDFNLYLSSINNLVQPILSTFETQFQEKQLTVTIDLGNNLPFVPYDTMYLRVAFENMLQNAIRYTQANGAITVRTYVDESNLILEIKDTGIGMSDEEQQRIFERFYRTDTVHSTRGFGLGLSIAHKIVEEHQGRIEVESTPGQGSTFNILLPVGTTDPEA